MATFEDFPGAGYLRLRGLPFSAGTKEVSDFLTEFGVMEANVILGTNAQGLPSGEAWVQFADQASADEARRQKDRQRIGGRYIEIFSSSYDDCTARSGGAMGAVGKGAYGGGAIAGGNSADTAGGFTDFLGAAYLRLRGLPFNATQKDVSDFFAEFGVMPEQVLMGSEGATGRPSGEAWIQLFNEDRQKMGHRYIEVFPSTAMDAGKATARPTQDRAAFRGAGAGAVAGAGACAGGAFGAGGDDWSWFMGAWPQFFGKGAGGFGQDRYAPY
ncbi:unnamed protein product [Effrenium voratum]|uniref:RRM domain-containing protein n=1 Tax=Effrenium voratum TaxID=2562239 RepID=A0AA36MYD7_9DINO|nr:unnamed protein product [Effrenium voratum]